MNRIHVVSFVLLVLVGLVAFVAHSPGQVPLAPGITANNSPNSWVDTRAIEPSRWVEPGVIPTQQAITPAGIQSVFQNRLHGISFGNSDSEIYVVTDGFLRSSKGKLIELNWKENRVVREFPLQGSPGLQGVRRDPSSGDILVTVGRRDKTADVELARVRNGALTVVSSQLGKHLAGAPAFPTGTQDQKVRFGLIPLTRDNSVAVVDLASGSIAGKVPVGVAPFAAAVSSSGTIAYISNWAGRQPRAGDLTAPLGRQPGADRAVIDDRGIASSGTIQRIDVSRREVTASIDVGLHPTSLAWDEAGARLYVANGNDDSISVIDTSTNTVKSTLALQPFARAVVGVTPTALILSRDRMRLFVACAGINAVAVIDTRTLRIAGLIPTGWYPIDLALSPSGKHLAVACLFGLGSGWIRNPRERMVLVNRSSAHVLPIPDEAQLEVYTAAVALNNRMVAPASMADRQASRQPRPVPRRPGDPSPIQHVVYIVKENRTYDQLFGDLAEGNGDPAFLLYGADVAPNHRKLARQFVLLDNFYAAGSSSDDGHAWMTQGNTTEYLVWPGYTGRGFPFDGTDPLAYAKGGFLWDAAARLGRTVRVYGEYAPADLDFARTAERSTLLEEWKRGSDFSDRWKVSSPIEPLNRILVPDFPTFNMNVPDVVRAQIFLKDLAEWERGGSMPNLIIMLLPGDHTAGLRPGGSTPAAMVADNDLAMGQIVEGLSKSRFWKSMAIFVAEDDGTEGVDHVDGHRVAAFAISPWIRRGTVDSTNYSHLSMLKTIELILGLEPFSMFDMISNDMQLSFRMEPDGTPYESEVPKESLFNKNPPLSALRGPARRAAIESARMPFDVPDAAPLPVLGRFLWHDRRGWSTPYPTPRLAAFKPSTHSVP